MFIKNKIIIEVLINTFLKLFNNIFKIELYYLIVGELYRTQDYLDILLTVYLGWEHIKKTNRLFQTSYGCVISYL